jgi:hypothetical protein
MTVRLEPWLYLADATEVLSPGMNKHPTAELHLLLMSTFLCQSCETCPVINTQVVAWQPWKLTLPS